MVDGRQLDPCPAGTVPVMIPARAVLAAAVLLFLGLGAWAAVTDRDFSPVDALIVAAVVALLLLRAQLPRWAREAGGEWKAERRARYFGRPHPRRRGALSRREEIRRRSQRVRHTQR